MAETQKPKLDFKIKLISYAITLVLIVGAFVLFSSCGSGINTSTTPEEQAADEQESNNITASVLAEEVIKDYLVSPSSADFPFYTNYSITHTGLRYKVEGYVDSDNAFGASLRNDFIVILEFVDGEMESYRAIYVQLGDEVYLDKL